MRKATVQDLLHPGNATDFFSLGTFPPFDPEAGGYNTGNALWLAELSRLVYRHDVEEEKAPLQPTRAAFLLKGGFQQRFFISKRIETNGILTDTQAMLVESVTPPSFAALVFRGTEQKIEDFFTDLAAWRDSLLQDTSSVHHGFNVAIGSVWSEIDAELTKLSCPVFYAGHSLGAALATLAAARRPPRAVYTFGSPRVGNEAFTASISNVSIYRVVDDKDIVTKVPLEQWGYRHAGEPHLLTERPPVARTLFTRLRLLFNKLLKELMDHAPVNYVDRIGRSIT